MRLSTKGLSWVGPLVRDAKPPSPTGEESRSRVEFTPRRGVCFAIRHTHLYMGGTIIAGRVQVKARPCRELAVEYLLESTKV